MFRSMKASSPSLHLRFISAWYEGDEGAVQQQKGDAMLLLPFLHPALFVLTVLVL